MSSGNLSSAQFGGSASPSVTPMQPQRPSSSAGDTPLALSGTASTSAQRAAAWRKPAGVLPYSSATAGSTFKPFG